MIRVAMKSLQTLLALGAGPILCAMFGVATSRAADDPKPEPKASSDVNKEMEAINARIDALRKDFERLEREMQERQEKNLMPSREAVRRNSPSEVEASTGKFKVARGKVVAVNKEWGFVVIDSDVARNAIEAGGTDYMTTKMSIEMAERHSAEKIKAQVKEADAKAQRILNGNPPSQVHEN